MEIERKLTLSTIKTHLQETKKISWKWRLKEPFDNPVRDHSYGETKKISWKWRLKVSFLTGRNGGLRYLETKKISWKWRLKAFFPYNHTYLLPYETKKISWKWRLKDIFHKLSVWQTIVRNKENLLKMEIERRILLRLDEYWKWRNKENLLKMEIESLRRGRGNNVLSRSKQRKSPENGDWKQGIPTTHDLYICKKQRKSPENGDWKE